MRTILGEISCKDKLREFKQRLDFSERMILSARFGDGKTYFLQKVVEDELFQKEYCFFTLYPVNYTISPNEDIFEYIKRDIMVQLGKKDVLNDIDIETLVDSVFTLESLKEVLAYLISFVPGSEVYKKLMNKLCDIGKRYEQDRKTVESYLKNFRLQKGGLYEEDGYTKMIRAGLKVIKNGNIVNNPEESGKKTVLVIEDLDRLDPAHLFRILNVVSAHIENCTRPDVVSNKFGFDKIVLVMDYETTEHLFEHFYGKGASYEGYMSKFISEEPFRYSLRDVAENKFKTVFSQLVGFPINNEWFGAIDKKITEYSIRDMNRICNIEYKTRVLKPYIEFFQEKFSTNLPVFRLLVYMAEMGIKKSDIVDCLNAFLYPDKENWLAMMYPIYLASSKRRFESYVDRTGDKLDGYNVRLQNDDGYVVGIACLKGIVRHRSSVSVDDNLETKIRHAIKVFSEYVNLSALNTSEVEYNDD